MPDGCGGAAAVRSLRLGGVESVLIGGVSGAGKTTVARSLRRANPAFASFEMDTVLRALDIASPPVSARSPALHGENVAFMQAFGPALLQAVFTGGAPTIVEGGWVEPPAWRDLAAACGRPTAALFFGYPSATPDMILDRLSGTRHWLAASPDRTFVEAQIRHSARLRNQTRDLPGAAFVDVSDGFVPDAQIDAILADLIG